MAGKKKDKRFARRMVLLTGIIACEVSSGMSSEEIFELAEFLRLLSTQLFVIAGYPDVPVPRTPAVPPEPPQG